MITNENTHYVSSSLYMWMYEIYVKYYRCLRVILTEVSISCNVALNEAISSVGISDMKPTVSTYRTLVLLGRRPACTVTSNVANNLSRGTIFLSPVTAFIRLVLPGKKITQIRKYNRNNVRNVKISRSQRTEMLQLCVSCIFLLFSYGLIYHRTVTTT